MGVIRYKRTVINDYQEKTIFVFSYNRSCDIGTLFVKQNADNPESKFEQKFNLCDNEIAALIDVLAAKEPIEGLTEEEKAICI